MKAIHPLALFAFNVGVEIGQRIFIAPFSAFRGARDGLNFWTSSNVTRGWLRLKRWTSWPHPGSSND
jgi:hypothetical protein